MRKKLKDFTIKEIVSVCMKYKDCNRCPFVNISHCSFGLEYPKEELETEVEIPE